MKKIGLIAFLTVYLVLNLGISMKVHYCGDAISFIDFFPVARKTCCGDEQSPCCKDKIAYASPDIDQETIGMVNFSFPDYAKFVLVIQDFSFLSIIDSENSRQVHPEYTDENFYYKIPLYLRNRAIRI